MLHNIAVINESTVVEDAEAAEIAKALQHQVNHDFRPIWGTNAAFTAIPKGGKPAAVRSTHKGGDVGIVRIMFPDRKASDHDALVEVSWDEFFRQFDESKLALLYEEDGLFSKVVGRDTVEKRERGDSRGAR